MRADWTYYGQRGVHIEYRDERQRQSIDHWSCRPPGYDDGDTFLDERQIFEVIVPVMGLPSRLGLNTRFSLEVKPPGGAPLQSERLTPPNIDIVMDLK